RQSDRHVCPGAEWEADPLPGIPHRPDLRRRRAHSRKQGAHPPAPEAGGILRAGTGGSQPGCESGRDPLRCGNATEKVGKRRRQAPPGEQGAGITVDVSTPGEVERAFRFAAENGDEVVLEQYVKGRDLRIIVIDHAFVAAIERTPARVTGDGRHTVRQLAEKANRKLREQTGGEARIPLDEETRRVVRQAGFDWDAVPPAGKTVPLRKTANFHTGGTIRDVTDQVPPRLRRIAEEASRILDIPVVGFDFIVPDYTGERYVIIEANERPGLANHEP